MRFLLDSYADSITIKQKRTALHKPDGTSTPPTLPRHPIFNDDDEYDFSFTSSSEDEFTSDDEQAPYSIGGSKTLTMRMDTHLVVE
jgi:hypothetical protein